MTGRRYSVREKRLYSLPTPAGSQVFRVIVAGGYPGLVQREGSERTPNSNHITTGGVRSKARQSTMSIQCIIGPPVATDEVVRQFQDCRVGSQTFPSI